MIITSQMLATISYWCRISKFEKGNCGDFDDGGGDEKYWPDLEEELIDKKKSTWQRIVLLLLVETFSSLLLPSQLWSWSKVHPLCRVASSKTIRLRSIRIIIWILLRFTTCESEWWQCTMMLMVSPLKDVNSTWASIAAFLSFAYLFGSKSRPTLKLNWFHLLFAEMQFKTKLY